MKARLGSFVVWYAVALHAFWGVAMLVDPVNAGGCTGIAALWPTRLGRWLGVMLLAIAGAAWWGATMPPHRNRWWRVSELIPQQFALCLSAWGAWTAMIEGHFADGVPRAFWFISPDQIHSVLIAGFHTWAMVCLVGDDA